MSLAQSSSPVPTHELISNNYCASQFQSPHFDFNPIRNPAPLSKQRSSLTGQYPPMLHPPGNRLRVAQPRRPKILEHGGRKFVRRVRQAGPPLYFTYNTKRISMGRADGFHWKGMLAVETASARRGVGVRRRGRAREARGDDDH